MNERLIKEMEMVEANYKLKMKLEKLKVEDKDLSMQLLSELKSHLLTFEN